MSSTADTIVNEWSGVGSHRRARGIEVWRLAPGLLRAKRSAGEPSHRTAPFS